MSDLRIISQDGTMDIPYSHLYVYLEGRQIMGHLVEDTVPDLELGTYRSIGEAKTVLSNIREHGFAFLSGKSDNCFIDLSKASAVSGQVPDRASYRIKKGVCK